jgi:hypothetical protein
MKLTNKTKYFIDIVTYNNNYPNEKLVYILLTGTELRKRGIKSYIKDTPAICLSQKKSVNKYFIYSISLVSPYIQECGIKYKQDFVGGK